MIVITLDKPSKVITPGRILKPSGIPEEAENEANGIGTIREKTYTENTTEEIKFLDVVGNEGSAVVEVTTFSSGNT
ncbi:MAG: hypothetical protein LBD11_01130 [Candidatus Peribacteria bacterium]|nr:hypothetical protein [Candidatus Peribacteria bacterium]